jgi:hypothetical protein
MTENTEVFIKRGLGLVSGLGTDTTDTFFRGNLANKGN